MKRLSWLIGVPVVALLGAFVGGIAVLNWGPVGLPAPVFFGAYYLAYLFDLTSG